MKRRPLLVLALALLLAPVWAASLPAMAPKGAVFTLYLRNLAVKKAFFVDFQAELERQRLTAKDLLALFGDEELDPDAQAELERFLKLASLDAVGQEGLLAVYPDGSFLALARPAASAARSFFDELKKTLGETKPYRGWNLKRLSQEGDEYELVAGYREGTAVMAGFPAKGPSLAAQLFEGGVERGLELALDGDLVLQIDFPPLAALAQPFLAGEDVPKRLAGLVRTPRRYASALSVVKQGLEGKSVFALDRDADPELAGILLKDCRPWPLADFPKADSVASYCFPLADLARYLNGLLGELELNLDLDLDAFGDRLALVSLTVPGQDPALALQKPLGDLLIYLEAKDDLTAETTLLTWLQVLAAAGTPEGEGGFQVERYEVGAYRGKRITLGIGQPVFLFNLGDRLVLATSEAAAQALAGPKLAEDPTYRRLAPRYPKDAVMLSYANAGPAIKLASEQLVATMPMFAEDPKELQAMMEFGQRLAKFLAFVGERVGAGVGYTRIEGDRRESYGLTEVRW